jgi:uncharacterized membrane protein
MSTDNAETPRLERLLAGLLHYGTWLASVVTALGITLALVERSSGTPDPTSLLGMRIVTMGIALFILLPIVRVTLMLVVFVHERDYRFIVIAALVLLIILLGFAFGMYLPSPMQGSH